MFSRFLLVCAALAVNLMAGAADVSPSSAYFVPENQLTFKMVFEDGSCREFERDYSKGGAVLRSENGWTGAFKDSGRIVVCSPGSKAEREKWEFLKGRLVAYTKGLGPRMEFPYDAKRVAPPKTVPPLQISREQTAKAAQAYAENEFQHKWEGSGRLAFPFVNPNQNGALYAELMLALLLASWVSSRKSVRLPLIGATVLMAVCLIWTMSRGAWLGALVALSGFAAVRFRSFFKTKWFWTGIGVVLATFAVWYVFQGADAVLRGFDGREMNWTNAIRLEIWRQTPRMMYEAPGGWAFGGTGAAYVNWYQPLQVFALTPTLINDHLTFMVGTDWCGRFLYVFVATLIAALSVGALVVRRTPAPFMLWAALAVPAWFNPVSHRWEMWILPVASSLFFIRDFPWRKVKAVVALVGSSLVFAGLTIGGIYLKGESEARQGEFVRAEGRRVCLHGPTPKIWVVDDGTLGGGLTGKDMREFYASTPEAPALGYVTSIGDLPSSVDVLVLAGHAGADWLTLLSENEKARARLPRIVVFVSPPFPPSSIPEGAVKACNARVIVGEFAALYEPEYESPPAWVTIVPGMEKYILRWMSWLLGG